MNDTNQFSADLLAKNPSFVRERFRADLKLLPSRRALVVGCVDPRVDPFDILGLAPAEAAVIRNIGGRVNPAFFETLDILQTVAHGAGKDLGAGWELIVLQHTDCGIIPGYRHAPEKIAHYMDIPEARLGELAITDPRAALAIDVATLRADRRVPEGFVVTGLLYDVATGKLEKIAVT